MKPIIPERLRQGDTVALIAPASPPLEPEHVDESIAALESLGFAVRLGRHARRRSGFLAGTPRERAEDVMRMFRDPRVKAIFCVRGGYGSAQILPRLDYEIIRRNPKILAGCSDVTSLLCALRVKTGLVTFHGPMPASDFIRADLPPFTRESFLRTLMQPEPPGGIRQGYSGDTVSVLRPGKAAGKLIGGNLSILCTLVGTPWEPSFRGKILFLEDVGEAPYRIDRMLTHLLNAGLLQQAAGIAIGLCKDCLDPRAKTSREPRQTLEDVFRERLRPLKVPVVTGLPFGHGPDNATIPIGIRAVLDAKSGDLEITQAAVR